MFNKWPLEESRICTGLIRADKHKVQINKLLDQQKYAADVDASYIVNTCEHMAFYPVAD